MTLEATLVTVAGVAAVLVALPSAYIALRDARRYREARQELLDALPTPQSRGILESSGSLKDEIDYYWRNSADLADLDSRLAGSPKSIYRVLQDLVREGKISVLVLDGPDENGPPGRRGGVPLFFKGGMLPSLRTDDETVAKILNAVRRDESRRK